jgi:hypothetical protein
LAVTFTGGGSIAVASGIKTLALVQLTARKTKPMVKMTNINKKDFFI